ncbi:hypothetical protein AtubIFM61612_004197 [Aspergillus tubingensis]|nr:hypothetical protein AtubIFM61612_004197 [Aspergillus tubingensis]
MEFLYSDPVDPQIVAQSCSTRLAVRKGRNSHIADTAIGEFREEWGSADRQGFCSSACPCGPFIALAVPEAKPERIAIVTKTLEFIFTLDDPIVDSTEFEKVASTRNWDTRGLVSERQLQYSVKARHDWGTRKTQLCTKILVDLLAIDPVRGQVVIEALEQYRSSLGGKRAVEIHDWDKWLAYRWENAGCAMFLGLIFYACELDLTRRDLDTVHHIAWKAMAMTVLSNDLYSFEMEAILGIQAGGRISNGVWHLMKHRNITAKEAKHILLIEKLRPLEEQFLEEKASFSRAHGRDLPQIVHYLDLLELAASGNWYWGSQCYRYHSWKENITQFGDRPISSYNIQKFDEATSKCEEYLKAAANNDQPSKLDDRQTGTLLKDQTMVKDNGDEVPREIQRQCLDEKLVFAPINYLESVPSKNIRGTLIEGLSSWFAVSRDALDLIKRVVSNIHSASLLIDDIEDGSPLRRGQPAAYRVFGRAQTINSANFLWVLISEDTFHLSKDSQRVIAGL